MASAIRMNAPFWRNCSVARAEALTGVERTTVQQASQNDFLEVFCTMFRAEVKFEPCTNLKAGRLAPHVKGNDQSAIVAFPITSRSPMSQPKFHTFKRIQRIGCGS